MTHILRLGTRGSALALAQSKWVASKLEGLGCAVEMEIIRTTGDNAADTPFAVPDVRGLFVREIEQALLDGRIDLAVHSMKDVPPEMPPGLAIAAVPTREDPRDVLIGRTAPTLAGLPSEAVVGTSSPRRKTQLLAARPDLRIADLRGNVDTRLRKLQEGQYDAICLAAAGLRRLGLSERITEYLEPATMMPAAGQGALTLQVRSDDQQAASALSALDDPNTRLAVDAERAVLAELGWGCSVPLGLLAKSDDGVISMNAVLCSADGKLVIREQISGSESPENLGREMARMLRARGEHLITGAV